MSKDADWRVAGVPPTFKRSFPPLDKADAYDVERWRDSQRGPEGVYWMCPHVPRCDHRPQCVIVAEREIAERAKRYKAGKRAATVITAPDDDLRLLR